jgi:hypothetical protein
VSIVDYDVPQNPPRVRPIYDEVRRVDAGLHLGRGMRRPSKPTPRLVFWFALDATLPDAPVQFAESARGRWPARP